MKRILLPGIGGVVLAVLMTPSLNAQQCFGNSDIIGPYAFAGYRNVFVGVPSTAPGTTGTVTTTPIGQLLNGVTGAGPFSAVGVVLADGQGNFFAQPSGTTGAGFQQLVGTYSANRDCTVTVTFNNVASTTGGTGSTATTNAVTFEGIELDRGNEIDLVQANATNPGAVLTLRRTFQNGGCTNATLTGTLGLIGQAFLTSTAAPGTGGPVGGVGSDTAVTPEPIIGRLVTTGNGIFGVDALSSNPALPNRQLTGTYTVNPDCTGTMTIVTKDGVARAAKFVITRPAGSCQNPGQVRPEVLFGFSDTGVSGVGSAR